MPRFGWFRIIVFAALIALAVPRQAMASGVVPLGNGHEMTIRTSSMFANARTLGDEPRDHASRWTELIVEATTYGTGFQGWFELRTVTSDEVVLVDARQRLDVATNQTLQLQLPIQADSGNRGHMIAVFAGELPLDDAAAKAAKPVFVESVRVGFAGGNLVVTADVHGMSVPQSGFPTCRECPRPTFVTAGNHFPLETATYDNVRMFVMQGARLDSTPRSVGPRTVSAAECLPLREWVERGGSLIVVEPDYVRANARAVLRCGLGDSAVTAFADSTPERRFGNGRIVFVSSAILDSAEGTRAIGRLYADAVASQIQPYAFVDPARFGRMRGGRWLAATGAGLFAFSLFSGPLLFRALRRRKTPERALTLLPIASVAMLALLLGLAALARPAKGESRVAVFEYASGQRGGRATVARGFLRPDGVVRTSRILPGSSIETADNAYELDGRDHYRVDTDGTIVLNEDRPKSDFVVLVETGSHTLPGPITIACTHDLCTIENESGADLEDTSLIVGNRGYVHAGRVGRHASIPIKAFRDRAELADDDAAAFDSAEVRSALGSASVLLIAAQRPSSSGELARRVRVTCSTGCEGAR